MTRIASIAGKMLFLTGLLAATLAQAAAPQVKTQAPGFYRMMLGDFEITALSDGTVVLPMTKLMTNVKPGEVERLLSARSWPIRCERRSMPIW